MSNTKKDDLPYMPFYVGDWLKATDIQVLPYDLKGLWFEMLCYMWESKERGVLLYSMEELSRLLRLSEDLLEQKLKVLSDFAIYSVRETDGAIYSRRMVKDQKIREIRKKSGELGGKASFASRFAQAKTQANTDIDNENGNEDVNIKYKGKRFIRPTLEQVKDFCKETGSKIDPEVFFHNYESTDWIKANGQKVKNWKSTLKTWEKRNLAKEEVMPKTQDPKKRYEETQKYLKDLEKGFVDE